MSIIISFLSAPKQNYVVAQFRIYIIQMSAINLGGYDLCIENNCI